MSYQQEKFKEIADAIREKTGETEPIKPSEFAEKIPEVYEAGMAEVLKDFNHGGSRTSYNYGLYSWRLTDEILKHLPPLKPQNATRMFSHTYEDADKYKVNLKNADIDFSECTTYAYAFYQSGVEEIGVIDASNVTASDGLYQMFYGRYGNAIRWIDKFIVSENTKFDLTFQQSWELEHCIFEGCIAKNGLALGTSDKLDRESILSVIDCLKDYSGDISGTSYSVTLGTPNKNKLTTAEIAVATQKGWSIA